METDVEILNRYEVEIAPSLISALLDQPPATRDELEKLTEFWRDLEDVPAEPSPATIRPCTCPLGDASSSTYCALHGTSWFGCTCPYVCPIHEIDPLV